MCSPKRPLAAFTNQTCQFHFNSFIDEDIDGCTLLLLVKDVGEFKAVVKNQGSPTEIETSELRKRKGHAFLMHFSYPVLYMFGDMISL